MERVWDMWDASDKEIEECEGDYIGCEICRYQDKCFELKMDKLSESLTKSLTERMIQNGNY